MMKNESGKLIDSKKDSRKKSAAALPEKKEVALPVRYRATFGDSRVDFGDSIAMSRSWPAPDVIIADGPYGLGKFPGEQATTQGLGAWYEPHVKEWTKRAKSGTTLWFWNSEIGWALVHSTLEAQGWEYEECCIWNKGVAHVAGNCNSKTIRGTPVVTEVAVRYTKKVKLKNDQGIEVPLKEWVRQEWLRSGLSMNKSNEACGVKNAATRKYLTRCHLWYFPPSDAMLKMAAFCEKHGEPNKGRPYFSMDGKSALDPVAWDALRAKWNHTHGQTNVWEHPAVHGVERCKNDAGYIHANQKPLALMRTQIRSSSDAGDVIWEPFGGLCSASVAAMQMGRRFFAAEVLPDFFDASVARLKKEQEKMREPNEPSKKIA